MNKQIIMITVKDFRYLKESFTQNIARILSFSFPMEMEGCRPTPFDTFTFFSYFFLFLFPDSFFVLGLFERLYKDDSNDWIDVALHIL